MFRVQVFVYISAIILFPIFCVQNGKTEEKRSLSDLTKLAEKMFSPKLALEVKNEIIARENARPYSENKSPVMLFISDSFYNSLEVGKFEGLPTITWNGYDEKNKKPNFTYDTSEFTYVTASGRRINPRKMETDGGSIPKLLHSVGNFTPWTYGPSFIIHDWIFEAHKCNYEPENSIDFETSAKIMAESIKTLMVVGIKREDGNIQKLAKAEDTLFLMYLAVKSRFARKIWDEKKASCR